MAQGSDQSMISTRISLESQSIEVTARIHLINLSSKDLLDNCFSRCRKALPLISVE
jgi:hypothetical protein